MSSQNIRRAHARPAAPGERAGDPVVTGPEMLARLLFEKYSGSPSDKRGVVLLDADARMLGTELILDPELHAQWFTPRLLDAVCGDAFTLVPFSYKPSVFAQGDPSDVKLVLTMTKWLRQFGLKLLDHLMLFSDGRWRSYGGAGYVDGVWNPAADYDP